MKTIIVDHDKHTELHWSGRFNNIIPLLRAYDCTDIILPDQIPKFIKSGHKIIYAITARIPLWSGEAAEYDDARWLQEITTEIPADIITLANDGHLHIAFFIGEIITISPERIQHEVDHLLLKTGINKTSITVYIPNFQLIKTPEPHIKFISIFEMSYLHDVKVRGGSDLSANIVTEVNLQPRGKKYTCLNHLQKTHRRIIAASLYNNNMHNDGYLSYHLPDEIVEGHPMAVLKNIDIHEFLNQTPFLVDTNNSEVVNYHWKVEKHFFNNAYWNFVTESFFADYHTLTEKTFKPIVNLQPFIIFAESGTLQMLHKLGYKTFSSVIDESYDRCEHHGDRMLALIDLAFKLVDMSDDEHIAMMTEIKPILEHNQNVFFNKTWTEFL